MKNLLLILAICLTLSCKKDLDRRLTTNNWNIESAKINPAMTIGTKSSTNYLELMGPASCAATTTLTFSEDGIFTSSANGALCDRFYDLKAAPATWSREGNQIIISLSSRYRLPKTKRVRQSPEHLNSSVMARLLS